MRYACASVHFERKFKYNTGFTPKEYSRIVKFKNAVELLRNTTFVNLLTTAIDAGYYDLSTFLKRNQNIVGQYTFIIPFAYRFPEDITLTYIEP